MTPSRFISVGFFVFRIRILYRNNPSKVETGHLFLRPVSLADAEVTFARPLALKTLEEIKNIIVTIFKLLDCWESELKK